eukprot:1307603-Rhodomonas_salina.1
MLCDGTARVQCSDNFFWDGTACIGCLPSCPDGPGGGKLLRVGCEGSQDARCVGCQAGYVCYGSQHAYCLEANAIPFGTSECFLPDGNECPLKGTSERRL